jgi:hypothetical protein
MKKSLIIDTMLFEPTPMRVDENTIDTSGCMIVKGVLQRANAKNNNSRVYPKDVLEREVQRYNDAFVVKNRALGELDHPESHIVSLQTASHAVISMEWQGDDLIGTVKILPTPCGNVLKNLFEAGITLGISSRGLGSLKQLGNGMVEVQDDYDLIAFDFVSNPSTHGAYLTPVNESYDPDSVDRFYKLNTIINRILKTDI